VLGSIQNYPLCALELKEEIIHINMTMGIQLSEYMKTSTPDHNGDRYLSSIINSFGAIAPYMGQEKGVLFYGGVSPSKIGLSAPS
jgi:hypothetical protein